MRSTRCVENTCSLFTPLLFGAPAPAPSRWCRVRAGGARRDGAVGGLARAAHALAAILPERVEQPRPGGHRDVRGGHHLRQRERRGRHLRPYACVLELVDSHAHSHLLALAAATLALGDYETAAAALGVHLAGRVLFDVSAALFWLRVLHMFTVSKTLGAYVTIMTRMVCSAPLPLLSLSLPPPPADVRLRSSFPLPLPNLKALCTCTYKFSRRCARRSYSWQSCSCLSSAGCVLCNCNCNYKKLRCLESLLTVRVCCCAGSGGQLPALPAVARRHRHRPQHHLPALHQHLRQQLLYQRYYFVIDRCRSITIS